MNICEWDFSAVTICFNYDPSIFAFHYGDWLFFYWGQIRKLFLSDIRVTSGKVHKNRESPGIASKKPCILVPAVDWIQNDSKTAMSRQRKFHPPHSGACNPEWAAARLLIQVEWFKFFPLVLTFPTFLAFRSRLWKLNDSLRTFIQIQYR